MVIKIVNIYFENFNILGKWDEKSEEYYFPVLEIISKMTDGENPKCIWTSIKKENGISSKFTDENIETVNSKDFFRIIQMIQSPKANQVKTWLAELGKNSIHDAIPKPTPGRNPLKLKF